MSCIAAFIRHGPTGWNAEKRLQGHSDQPLSARGISDVQTWLLPERLAGFKPCSSPLQRARQTAEILFGQEVPTDDRLIEMNYGDWEGQCLPELRDRLGSDLADNEARGLDFTPPNGESPRMVQKRLKSLLRHWAYHHENRVAVAHKGVIRALYAQAAGWDMTGKIPNKLDWNSAHLFSISPDGLPDILELNLSLQP